MIPIYHHIENPRIKRRSEYKDRLEDYVVYTSASYGQPFAYSIIKNIDTPSLLPPPTSPPNSLPVPAPAPPCFSFLTNIYSCFLYK